MPDFSNIWNEIIEKHDIYQAMTLYEADIRGISTDHPSMEDTKNDRLSIVNLEYELRRIKYV